jgi:hypothetical protein
MERESRRSHRIRVEQRNVCGLWPNNGRLGETDGANKRPNVRHQWSQWKTTRLFYSQHVLKLARRGLGCSRIGRVAWTGVVLELGESPVGDDGPSCRVGMAGPNRESVRSDQGERLVACEGGLNLAGASPGDDCSRNGSETVL